MYEENTGKILSIVSIYLIKYHLLLEILDLVVRITQTGHRNKIDSPYFTVLLHYFCHLDLTPAITKSQHVINKCI